MDELTKMALVGTSKLAGAVPGDDHRAAALVASLVCDDREEMFLLSAGVRGVYRLAGAQPRANVPALDAAPADTKKLASRKIAGLLQNAIAAKADDLLKEFLRRLCDAEIALPPDLLPALLDSTDAEIRELLLPVIGKRGEWLSRLNPEWSWVRMGISHHTATDQQSLKRVWDEGNISERCQVISTLRAAEPARAREWVAEVLAKEKPNHRVSLIEVLSVGLSADDEPFLEGCLNDRSSLVGQAAVQLLCGLTQSALAARMRTRADDMLSIETSGIVRKQIKLACSPPEKIDRSWELDGIPKQVPAGLGPRAFWAERTLAVVPPSHWSERFGLKPAELIAASLEDPFAEAVLAGWTAAAARFAADDPGSAEWLPPLWAHWAGTLGPLDGAGTSQALQRLDIVLQKLTKPAAEAGVIALFESGVVGGRALGFLHTLLKPWSDDFSLRLLNVFRHEFQTHEDDSTHLWAHLLSTIARSIPPAAFAIALEPWEIVGPHGTPAWLVDAVKREIDKFVETIDTRRSFITELNA